MQRNPLSGYTTDSYSFVAEKRIVVKTPGPDVVYNMHQIFIRRYVTYSYAYSSIFTL